MTCKLVLYTFIIDLSTTNNKLFEISALQFIECVCTFLNMLLVSTNIYQYVTKHVWISYCHLKESGDFLDVVKKYSNRMLSTNFFCDIFSNISPFYQTFKFIVVISQYLDIFIYMKMKALYICDKFIFTYILFLSRISWFKVFCR